MDMNICIRKEQEDRYVVIEAFGLSLSLSGLTCDCPMTISEDNKGIAIRIGAADTSLVEVCEDEAHQHESCEEAVQEDDIPCEVLQSEDSHNEDELFKSLSALRKRISSDAGLPPYVVFHDNTLKEMSKKLPLDLHTLSTLQGVGKAKLDKYGELFIAAIKEHTEERGR